MEVPCVRVPREDGEAVRRELAEVDVIDREYHIDATDGSVYIPIQTTESLPNEYPVVTRDLEPRDRQTLPQDLLDGDISYERLGDLALIDEDDPERAQDVADALMESSLPIEGVLNRTSKIEGEFRVRTWEILAGDRTETIHREFGAAFAVDVTKAYFSPRLATERHRVVGQVDLGERVFDMFAGVGPFAIPMAMAGATVVATDVNPAAIAYLTENADRNGVSDRVTAINADVREVTSEYEGWADRLVMNLPHTADRFLDAAGVIAGDRCRLHYYDIQPDNDPFGPGEQAMEASLGSEFSIEVINRRAVRSYAPHEVNVCLDVDIRRRR